MADAISRPHAFTSTLQRIQLLQDFEMPVASTRIKMTPDQQHIMATGMYRIWG